MLKADRAVEDGPRRSAESRWKHFRISGYVTDPHGAVIPFGVVFDNQTCQRSNTVPCNASARAFMNLRTWPPGDYKIKFEAGGFEMKEIEISVWVSSEINRTCSWEFNRSARSFKLTETALNFLTIGWHRHCGNTHAEKRNPPGRSRS